VTGDCLHRIARHVLRAETCRTILEPAIADLQHEAGRGQTWRVRGYIGVCRAFAGALSIDIAMETSRAFSAMARATGVASSGKRSVDRGGSGVWRAQSLSFCRSSRLILAGAGTRAGAIGRIRDRIELAAHPGDKISKRVRVGPRQAGNALRLSRLRLRLHAL
jgi:hypothetical protein